MAKGKAEEAGRGPRSRRQVVGAVLLAAAAATVVMPVAAPVARSVQEVLVLNGPDQALPTRAQGTTEVAGTITIADGNVVRIADHRPIRVEQPGEYVQGTSPMTMQPDERFHREVLVEVPAGKRFIAERASGELLLAGPGFVRVRFGEVNGTEHGVEPTVPPDAPGTSRALYNDELHFQVDGPAQVQALIVRSDSDAQFPMSHHTTLVGRLVDCGTCVGEG